MDGPGVEALGGARLGWQPMRASDELPGVMGGFASLSPSSKYLLIVWMLAPVCVVLPHVLT